MADSLAPVSPAVASFDPLEWTKKIEGLNRRISDLEGDKQSLEKQVFDLKSEATRQANAASAARGVMKPLKDDLQAAREKLASSENLKELGQLRAEIAKAHAQAAVRLKAQAEFEQATKAKMEDLTHRANRAEGKFQALEATASMMATSRDKSNAAAAALLVERDAAQKMVEELKVDLIQRQAEYVKLRAELEKAQAETKALKQAPAKAK